MMQEDHHVEQMPEVAEEDWKKAQETEQDHQHPTDGLYSPLPKLRFPIDSEGFPISFRIEDEKEIIECFEKYGVVIVRDIFGQDTPKRVQNTIEGIWTEPELLGNGKVFCLL